MRYINYHKHTHYSNLSTLDCVVKPEDYMKRAKELGHKEYVTTEHGSQGNIYEAQALCEKYGLKAIYGIEAYYVDNLDDETKSRTAYHIIIIAMNGDGEKEINNILSIANTKGFYYKPRIDLGCMLSLTPKNVVVTTGCIASRMFKSNNYEDKFLKPLHNHFKEHFFLEIQSHNTLSQIEYNKKILDVHNKYKIPLIHANDSHYIKKSDSKYRDLFLKAKGFNYDDETGFILDYPDSDTIFERYEKQGVFAYTQIREALENTLILDNSKGICVNKEFKLPNISLKTINDELNLNFENLNYDEILKRIILKEWQKEKQNLKTNKLKEYTKNIVYEMDIIEKCGMAKYFVINYLIVKKSINEYGAVLTRSGRGSAVSFYINKLLGLTEIDRLKSPITLYPTRFMSAERILNSKSLPDIDLNFADVEPVIKASKDILGEDGIYPMIAYKPLQKSSAFRLWCKANNYNLKDYDDIAKNLENYENHFKWGKVIENSKVFIGVIESVAPSPCSFLLLDKPISKEIGLRKVGDIICCNMDGYNCDYYKFLKNDYLTVTVYKIIDEVYKLIGRPIDDIGTLINNCDDKVWKLYENGLTTAINQADSNFGKQTLKRYKPKSLSELSGWVAAIRPGFASLMNNFLDREKYSTGVKELDKILEDSFCYLLYQESIMKLLVWLNVEEKETYDIIKKISKKKFKEDELKALKDKLLNEWIKKLNTQKGFNETWQVVEDASRYSFNASHSLSVAIDSLYGAYLKSHYPLEFFTVALNIYQDDIDRTNNLINELPFFDITLKPILFGKSKADYAFDKKENAIYKGIASIKYCNKSLANDLENLSVNNYDSFIKLLQDIKNKTKIDTRQLKILIVLNFFKRYGKNKYLLNICDVYDKFYKCKQVSKDKLESLNLDESVIKKYSSNETEKLYKGIDNIGLIYELVKKIENKSISIIEQIKQEKEYLGYTTYTNEKADENYYIVLDFENFNGNGKPRFIVRNLKTGKEIKMRIKNSKIFRSDIFAEFSVIKIKEFELEFKKKPVFDEKGKAKWVSTDETENVLYDYGVIVK